MFPVAWFFNLNSFIPPCQVTASGLMVGCACVLYFSLKKGGSRLFGVLPALIYVLVGALYLLSSSDLLQKMPLIYLLVIAVLAKILSPAGEAERKDSGASRISKFYLSICLFVSTLLLFHQLGSYAKPFMSWESPVSWWFRCSFQNGVGIWSYLGNALLWDEGLISSGDKSLLYGVPTYALVHFTGFTLWAIRIVSVISALCSIVVIYLAGKRFFGPVVGGAAAVLLAANVNFFFHARYGTSPSATTLALLCALYCVWLIFLSDRPAWWHGLLAGGTLGLATFNYSPGRLVVLTLAALVVFWAVFSWRRISRQQAAAVILMAGMLAGLWCWQKMEGHGEEFLRAKGEHYFYILQSAGSLKKYLGRDVDPSRITFSEKLELARKLAGRTLSEYLWLLTPGCKEIPPGEAISNYNSYGLPPIPLYYGPMALFILWGIACSLRRIKDLRHLSLLAWMVLCSFPLLLSTHVDAYRTMILVLPLTIWAALGIKEAVKVMRNAGVPSWQQHVLAILVALSLLQNVVQNCFFPAETSHLSTGFSSHSLAVAKTKKTVLTAESGLLMNKKDGSVLVPVPAGDFWMGSPDFDREGTNEERPYHKVYLDTYYIGRYEVTNVQYAAFVNMTGYKAEGNWEKYCRADRMKHPVSGVSWNDAKAYCDWAGLRLPTEAEWEKAARGTKWRKFPWGNKFEDKGRCNKNTRGTTPVGSFPAGSSPYGCLDMAGNVWEWCHDWYDGSYYDSSPRDNPQGAEYGYGGGRVLRGGSWFISSSRFFRTSFRLMYVPDIWDCFNGFRVACSEKKTGSGDNNRPRRK